MHKQRILFWVILCILFAICLAIYHYMYVPKKIKIISEYKIECKRQTRGNGWAIITSLETQKIYEDLYGMQMPDNDYSENYLLWSDGRRIKKIVYRNVTKFESDFKVPIGFEEFEGECCPHTAFIYKINKVLVKQCSD